MKLRKAHRSRSKLLIDGKTFCLKMIIQSETKPAKKSVFERKKFWNFIWSH
jgi:hypothetical protein